MKNSALSSRKFKYGSLSVAMTCVIIAAVILVNGVFKGEMSGIENNLAIEHYPVIPLSPHAGMILPLFNRTDF